MLAQATNVTGVKAARAWLSQARSCVVPETLSKPSEFVETSLSNAIARTPTFNGSEPAQLKRLSLAFGLLATVLLPR